MPRPNKNYEPKKEALAQTAFDLFMEYGYENVTVTQIMRAAGLTKAGMYHYFSSKEEILDAAIDYGLAQDLYKLRADLTGLSAEEKLLRFVRGNATHSDLNLKLMRYKGSNNDSYAAYRIRERSIHADIPLLEEIIREGITNGLYTAEYPRQAAEFLVLLVKAIAESNILPPASQEERIFRMQAFLQLTESWLHPAPDFMAAIEAMFREELFKAGETV
jgi:AcrR family transcriptional regulator